MKASSLQENFAKGPSIVERAVATRSTLPVLSNILLSTDPGRKLSATHLEIGITCWIGKAEKDGATTILARNGTRGGRPRSRRWKGSSSPQSD